MYAFLFVTLIIWVSMWLFMKFMYPKPPKQFMPQEGDVITPRDCDFCGYPLAEYRGIVETKPDATPMIDEENAQYTDSNGRDSKEVEDTIIVERKSLTRAERKAQKLNAQAAQKQADKKRREHELANTWFFCNQEHQARFHAKESDTPPK